MLRAALILASIHAQTPPPASDPPAEPSPPACADDASWHKKDDEAKNCQWVSELLPTRCDVHGDDKTAQEASIMAICARCKREQRSNNRSLEMSERQSSYEPPVVQGERVPTPMGRVPPSKLDSPSGAVV